MIANHKGKTGLFIVSVLLAACAAKPPHVQDLSASADVTAEIENTQSMLNEAKKNSLDILAPKNFERAEVSLKDAREDLVDGKTKEKILATVAESRGWLEEAQTRGEITRTAGKDIPEARNRAVRANAPAIYPKEFKKIDDQVREYARQAEKGDVGKLVKEGDRIIETYRKLETEAVTKNFLSEAQINVAAAQKAEAAKYSPKTLAVAEEKLNSALAMIKENPGNTEAITKAATEASEQSKFLLVVNEKTKAGNTEDLVLQTEKQRRVISGLTVGYAATESALIQKDAALKTAAQLRSELKPNEAEVFVENNAVKVRLKGVQFGSNQATINKKSAALLDKVDKVLGTVGASSILVEGYTDSVGTAEANRAISEKRAQAVQDYLVQKGQISSNQVKASGLGEENPISDNKTSRGRSENRRIDLLIEPKIE